jgi:hypothetical protein
MFVTRRPRGAKPKVKGAQGPAGQPRFESVQAETWWLHSHVDLQEYPMLESSWKLTRVARRPCGWPPDLPSPPNQLN